MIADCFFYCHEFKMYGSAHAHLMIKLVLPKDILNLVSMVYLGQKAIEMLQCAVEYH